EQRATNRSRICLHLRLVNTAKVVKRLIKEGIGDRGGCGSATYACSLVLPRSAVCCGHAYARVAAIARDPIAPTSVGVLDGGASGKRYRSDPPSHASWISRRALVGKAIGTLVGK